MADKVRKVASEGGLKHICMYYVYVLKCANGRLYIGCTNNLKERLERHSNGHVSATKGVLTVKLVTYTCFPNKYTTFNFEKYLKSGSGRAFMKKHLL
jgi:predicted GIY-YIG superfamily endonuclease